MTPARGLLRLALLAALAFGAVALVGAGEAPQAHAQDCKVKTYRFYPGSTIGRVRYGRADVTFTACAGDHGRDIRSQTALLTNSTGKNLGYFMSNIRVVPKKVSRSGATLELRWTGESCVPRVGWPCYGSGEWSVRFRISTRHGVKMKVGRTRTPDWGFTLYRTP